LPLKINKIALDLKVTDFQNIISWSSTGIVGGFDHIFLIIFGQGKKAQR